MKPLILAVGIFGLPSVGLCQGGRHPAADVGRGGCVLPGRTEPREPGRPAGDRAPCNQRFLQLVDRKNIQAILKEHAIALGNLKDTASAVALGKFAGADYLLHVLASNDKVAIRLVEVATRQVKLEQQFAVAGDLPLVAVSVREKVLAVVRPESQAAHRLTVGIAGFPNRSGTGRSDKLGIELQAALRKRLKDHPWAVVLERQYPTALWRSRPDSHGPGSRQDDREAFAGRPRGPGNDAGCRQELRTRQTVAGGARSDPPFCVVRRDKSAGRSPPTRWKRRPARSCSSVDEYRRSLTVPKTAVSEKELWRRQGLYLMPPSGTPDILARTASSTNAQRGCRRDVADVDKRWLVGCG